MNIESCIQSNRSEISRPVVWDPVAFNDLSQEIIFQIFSFLSLSDLTQCRGINKMCHNIADDPQLVFAAIWSELNSLKQMGLLILGEEAWKEKKIDPVPLPSRNIVEALKKSCPWSSDKTLKVFQTHTLVLLPQIVDDTPLGLKYFEIDLIFQNFGHGYEDDYYNVKESYWILIKSRVATDFDLSDIRTYEDVYKSVTSVKPYDLVTPLELNTSVYLNLINVMDPIRIGDVFCYWIDAICKGNADSFVTGILSNEHGGWGILWHFPFGHTYRTLRSLPLPVRRFPTHHNFATQDNFGSS